MYISIDRRNPTVKNLYTPNVVILLLYFLYSAQAQHTDTLLTSLVNSSKDIYAEQDGSFNSIRVEQIGSAGLNKSYISQIGNENISVMNQNQTGSIVNAALIEQKGNQNYAHLIQNGYGNRSSIHQVGTSNKSILHVYSNNATTELIQQGNNNTSTQIIHPHDFSALVIQQGHSNELMHIDFSKTRQPLRVIQTGNNIKTVIIQGR